MISRKIKCLKTIIRFDRHQAGAMGYQHHIPVKQQENIQWLELSEGTAVCHISWIWTSKNYYNIYTYFILLLACIPKSRKMYKFGIPSAVAHYIPRHPLYIPIRKMLHLVLSSISRCWITLMRRVPAVARTWQNKIFDWYRLPYSILTHHSRYNTHNIPMGQTTKSFH